jgi:hypothetical protein
MGGVVNKHGKKLMPCHPAKARRLLTQGKAVPLNNGELFAVRLLSGSSGYRQAIIPWALTAVMPRAVSPGLQGGTGCVQRKQL